MTRHRTVAATAALALLATACGLVAPRDPADPVAEGEAIADDDLADETIELARFFGDCEEATLGVTDVSQAGTECEVIQILTNAFNADNESGIAVERLGGAQFAAYYDTLNATYAGGSPPDVAVMHAANLPDYANRGLLVEIGGALEDAGIDPSTWTDPAREGVTLDDGVYGVPFDVHALLGHVNVDLMAQAGLVDDQGEPVLPTSPDELLEHARRVEEATGAQYFAVDANQFALDVMVFLSLLYQQGGGVVTEDGTRADIDSAAGNEALSFMNTLFDEGVLDPTQDYTAAQTAFLGGEVAVLANGTWVVNQYAAEAGFDYRTVPFPTLYGEAATWANSHVWVLPVQGDPSRYREALEFVAFLSDNVDAWSIGTGHLPTQEAVLSSAAFTDAPQRTSFAEATVERARLLPQVGSWQPIEDVIKREIESTWLSGAPVEGALEAAQREIDLLLDQNRTG